MSAWREFSEAFLNADIARDSLPALVEACWTTIWLSLGVVTSGVAAGLLLAMLRAFGLRPLNWLIIFFADFFRTMPPLVLICMFYFGLPSAGIPLSGVVSSWLALALILAAYAEECFWAGISATNRGQWEAARSTGLTTLQTLLYVILPQATRIAIAPLTSRTIAIAKGTAYASVVAVPELLGAAQSALTYTYNATPLLMAAVAYCLLFTPVVLIGYRIERRFTWKRQ